MQERGRRPKARASPARVEKTRCGHNRACSARPHTPARALLGPAWRAPGRTALSPHRYRPAQPPAPAGTATRGRSSRSGPVRGSRGPARPGGCACAWRGWGGPAAPEKAAGQGGGHVFGATRAGCAPAAPPPHRGHFSTQKVVIFPSRPRGGNPW